MESNRAVSARLYHVSIELHRRLFIDRELLYQQIYLMFMFFWLRSDEIYYFGVHTLLKNIYRMRVIVHTK